MKLSIDLPKLPFLHRMNQLDCTLRFFVKKHYGGDDYGIF